MSSHPRCSKRLSSGFCFWHATDTCNPRLLPLERHITSRAAALPAATSRRLATAVLTMVPATGAHNLRQWLGYYGSRFPARDLFVFLHITEVGCRGYRQQCTDGMAERGFVTRGRKASTLPRELVSAHGRGVRFIAARCNRGFLDGREKVRLFNELTARLFRASPATDRWPILARGYSSVICTDHDEFLVPNPRLYPGGLAQYIKQAFHSSASNMTPPWRRGHGLTLRQNPDDGEGPLDRTRPILSQRRWAFNDDPWYCKPIIIGTPGEWSAGQHSFRPADPSLLAQYGEAKATLEACDRFADPALILLHTKCADQNYLRLFYAQRTASDTKLSDEVWRRVWEDSRPCGTHSRPSRHALGRLPADYQHETNSSSRFAFALF
jgi:hypothetical protein